MAQDPAILQMIYSAAEKYGVPPEEVATIASIESNFNPKATSPVGAKGVMQLMDPTAKMLGVQNSYDPAQNIDAGVRYFKQLKDRYNGDSELAAMAYNSGPGRADKYGKNYQYYPQETQKYREKFLAGVGGQAQTPSGEQVFNPDTLNALLSTSQQLPDPSQFQMQIPKENGVDKFNKVAATIGNVGGSLANIIGAVKGNYGVGNPLLESTSAQLADDQKRKLIQQQMQQYNQFLTNSNVPVEARLAAAYEKLGVPSGVIASLLPTNKVEQAQKLANLIKTTKDIGGIDAEQQAKQLQNIKLLQEVTGTKPEERTSEAKNLDMYIKLGEELDQLRQQGKDNTPTFKAKEALYNKQTKAELTPDRVSRMEQTLFSETGAGTKYNAAHQSLQYLNQFEDILKDITPEDFGRVGGNVQKLLYKVKGDAGVAAYESLKEIIASKVTRQVLGEKGNLNEQENKRALNMTDLITSNKDEMIAKIDVLRKGFENAARSYYGQINLASKRFDPNNPDKFREEWVGMGSLLGTPDQVLRGTRTVKFQNNNSVPAPVQQGEVPKNLGQFEQGADGVWRLKQ